MSIFSLLLYCVGCGSNPSQPATTQDPAVVPSIAQVLPQTIPAGSQATTLKITGTNFPAQAVVLWNGAAVTTTVVDANTLSGTIAGSSLATPATVPLQVQNAQTMQESQAVLVTVAAASTASSSSPLAISTSTLAAASEGTAYTASLAAAGGTSPYTWSVTSGTLPAGLSLAAATGIISGTPTSSGNFSFGITAVDASSPAESESASVAMSVAAEPTENPALDIKTSSVASGTVGTAYSATLVAAGGSSPYTWSVSSGTLPAGLSLAAATGVISGTPSSSGNFSFSIRAVDASSPTESESASLAISVAAEPTASAALNIKTSSVASGTVGTAYSTTLVASGGSSPYTWSISSGALPEGLSLAAKTGIISGTPTSSGAFSFGIKANDVSSPMQSMTTTLALSVAAAPVVAPPAPVSVLPTPPSSAGAFLNLQEKTGWKVCNGTCAGSPSTTTGTSSFNQGISSPSMSGSAMEENSTGTFWNTLYYLHVGCPAEGCAAVSNMLEDMYFQTTSTSDMQGSEFDPDLYDGQYEYFASLQCRLVGADAGNWFLWNMSANHWEMTNYPCTASTIAPGSWHHFQLYATFNTTAHTYTYETFVLDGVTVFKDLGTTYEASPLTGTPTVNIEQQIDNGAETNPVPNNTNYYDKVNLWAW